MLRIPFIKGQKSKENFGHCFWKIETGGLWAFVAVILIIAPVILPSSDIGGI